MKAALIWEHGGLDKVRVIVTSSSRDKLAKAADLGADHAIDYAHEDVAAAVNDATGGRADNERCIACP